MVREISLSEMFTTISQQDFSGIGLDWSICAPLLACAIFLIILTLTCLVSKRLVDRRLATEDQFLPITDLRNLKDARLRSPLTLAESRDLTSDSKVSPNHNSKEMFSPVTKPDHVTILKVDSPSQVDLQTGKTNFGFESEVATTNVKTSSKATYDVIASSKVTTDARTSSVATSVTFYDQSYDDDDVFQPVDNTASTVIRNKLSAAIPKMIRYMSCPELSTNHVNIFNQQSVLTNSYTSTISDYFSQDEITVPYSTNKYQ